ncbi:ketoacyl-synt-domain-containing protein [Thelephora ganbajun]|uniref:Ketoacyl-synt-domain-containing protein n=1 Tax=Thelephora ganbajun TaxID=370292 RepID=A0ACB6Z9A7_THEGA|nr:ketoacyl-synt-domain-containing protein [Thelephora ganbajun]
MDVTPGKVVVPIFSSLGTTAATSEAWLSQSLSDSHSPHGSLLLQSCYRAFLKELASLSSNDLRLMGISLDDFPTPISLLTHERNINHILLSHSFLFLSQALRWLSINDYSQRDAFVQPFDVTVGYLSFSLGVLIAPVVASSTTLLDYLYSAVEAYKLTLWIGIRVHLYHNNNPSASCITLREPSWSIVCAGLGPLAAQRLITDFHTANQDHPHIFLTATLSSSGVTISGPPRALAAFTDSYPDAFLVLPAHTYALYHVESVHKGTRNQVLCDIRDRGIKFPTRDTLKAPIISTFTGAPATSSAPLVEEIVDMVLTQVVDWDRVVSSTVERLKSLRRPVEVLNVGPGNSLANGFERQISAAGLDVRLRDISISKHVPPVMEPIAVVGMAVNMPGAPNIDRLWELLHKGESTLSQIPGTRFDTTSIPAYLDSPSIVSRMGNFLPNPAAFDHKFFNVSPRAAEAMDPQQRILLHVAHEALENAGYVPDSTQSWNREGFGCFIGAATGDWADCLREQADLYHSTGTLRAFLSGRVSHFLKWGGPSVVVDTACSSSIVAIYQACRALQNGDCNAALAGGVNIICSPDNFVGLSKGRFLSPTGQCKPFDASADGYARSEGCGLFVLKLLSSAVEENDRILGVIRGVEINQNCGNTSITRPDVESQRSLFERLCLRSGTNPQHVSVIEAHGTGTQVGDKCEIESIGLVFGSTERSPSIDRGGSTSTPRLLHVGSVKANIGHLEAASGAAGLAKLLLMLRNRKVPKLISLNMLNSELGSEEELMERGIMFDREDVEWDATGKKIAVLNNFGAAGSNGALILEEYTAEVLTNTLDGSPPTSTQSYPIIFGFSAKTPEAVGELRSRYLTYLRSISGLTTPSLRDLAYTSTARRQLYTHRVSISADSVDSLTSSLESAVPSQVMSVKKVAFVFSGQGVQYLGMGRQLYWTNDVFRCHVHECQRILEGFGFGAMIKWISSGPSVSGPPSSTQSLPIQAEKTFPDARSNDGVEALLDYQTAAFTVGYSLAKLWISWGVEPSVVIGHSLGEYPALVIAGVISVESALYLLLHRANIMREKCQIGASGMYAARVMDSKKLFWCMEGLDVSVACYQTSTDFVLAGKTEDLQILRKDLHAIGETRHQFVGLPLGFHSAHMDTVLEDFAKVAKGILVRPPTIPVVSTVLDAVVRPGTPDVFTADYFVQHSRMPVLFVQATSRLIEEFGAPDLWLELGPTALFLSSIAALPQLSRPGAIKPLLLPSLKKTESPWSTLSATLAKLYLTNLPIRWREIFNNRQMQAPRVVDLPSYPFQTIDFWTSYQSNRCNHARNSPGRFTVILDGYSLLKRQTQVPTWMNGRVAVYETPAAALAKFIEGHMVAGNALCPASVYTELGLAAGKSSTSSGSEIFVLSELEFTKPFVYLHGSRQTLVTVVTTIDDGLGYFNVCSGSTRDGEEELHCRGVYLVGRTDEAVLSALASAYEDAAPCISSLTSTSRDGVKGREKEVFSRRTVYDLLFPRVVVYSKDYQTIQSFTVSSDSTEGYATLRLPFDRDRGRFAVHPIFVDSVLQVAGFLANMQGGVRDVHICDAVDTIRVLVEAMDDDAEYGAYCKSVGFAEGGVDIVMCEVVVVKLGGLAVEVPEVVVQAKGVRFKKLQLDSLVRRLKPVPVVPVASNNTTQATLPPSRPPIRRAKAASFSMWDLPSPPVKAPVDHTPEVIKIVATACGVDSAAITPGSDLRSLGVDSLLLMEITHKLQKSSAISFRCSSSALALCHTVADIVSFIASRPGSPVAVRKRANSTVSLLAISEEENVHHPLADTLGVEQSKPGATDDLGSHGLDSLSAAEVFGALKEEFDVSLPRDFFDKYRTVAQVRGQIWQHSAVHTSRPTTRPHSNSSSSILSLVSVGSTTSADPCVLIRGTYQPTAARTAPLFMIHDGSGLINSYEQIGEIGRPVYGIKDPYFGTQESWADIASVGREYAQLISGQSDGGPVIVGGWSFGGVVAFEIGCLMMKEGFDVKGVVLVDAPCPSDHVPLSAALLDHIVTQGKPSWSETETMGTVKEQLRKSSELLERYSPSSDGSYPRVAFLRSREGMKVESESMEKAPVWLADRQEPETTVNGWETLLKGKLKRWDVPGDHFQPFLPENIEETSRCIAEACRYLDPHAKEPASS